MDDTGAIVKPNYSAFVDICYSIKVVFEMPGNTDFYFYRKVATRLDEIGELKWMGELKKILN